MTDADFPRKCRFLYERDGIVLHVQTKSLTNHEMRNILIGFWLTLDQADRLDHIDELTHYVTQPGSYPPPAAVEMAAAVVKARGAQ